MKKKLLLSNAAILLISAGLQAQTVLFSQDFNSSTTVDDYKGSGDNQFNGFGVGTGSGTTVDIVNVNPSPVDNQVVFTRTNSTQQAGFSRSTALPTATQTFVQFSIDMGVTSGVNTSAQSQAAILCMGAGLNNGLTLPNLSGSVVNQYFYINTTANGNFTITANENTPVTSSEFSGMQTIKWFINKKGQAVNYPAPDGTHPVLADNQADIWVGTSRIASGIPAHASGANSGLKTFRLAFDTNNPSTTTLNIDNVIVTDLTDIVTLPVSLTSFTGKATNNGVQLSWQTASEQNNSHFNILHSTNGKDFIKIGQIEGGNNSSEIKNYTFNDANATPGLNYYQLQQVDYNGNSKTYDAIAVNVTLAENQSGLRVYTSETSVKLDIYSLSAQPAQVRILDLHGRTIIKKSVQLITGSNQISLPVSLASGLYVANLSVNNLNIAKKFAK
ncbi:T9SS type A sorting domain-containing protein [Pedobacter sp. BS3]|uniref:T9SS type A sorting domain-containing protein n=1 Tax=Pedobacter sp. BS3 TaxID=2567937 RepID=UPI0011EDC9EF|nr:T9SS type A sorting domain-containing protein [Pedobacter sp. BS3]TZF82611.1 T9SS type A sorting domain-containing protein [Pedobacter sp. BS3]